MYVLGTETQNISPSGATIRRSLQAGRGFVTFSVVVHEPLNFDRIRFDGHAF
jgi:hypothetical protein